MQLELAIEEEERIKEMEAKYDEQKRLEKMEKQRLKK
jgi:hypothetical protein